VGLDHLSILELGESEWSIDDELLDTHLFCIEVVPEYLKRLLPFVP